LQQRTKEHLQEGDRHLAVLCFCIFEAARCLLSARCLEEATTKTADGEKDGMDILENKTFVWDDYDVGGPI